MEKMKKILVLTCFAAIFCVNIMAQEANESPLQPKKTYRFTLGGGYAHRLGKMEKTGLAEIDDFSKKLRHGFNLEAAGQLFFNENIGIGLNAIYIRQHESEPDRVIPTSTGFQTIKLRETTQFFYVGPAFVARTQPNKFRVYGEAGIGLLVFNDSGEVWDFEADLTRPTVGFHLGISPEYRISSQLGIGLKLALTSGFIRTSFYGGKEKTWNVSNLSIGTFISFRTK